MGVCIGDDFLGDAGQGANFDAFQGANLLPYNIAAVRALNGGILVIAQVFVLHRVLVRPLEVLALDAEIDQFFAFFGIEEIQQIHGGFRMGAGSGNAQVMIIVIDIIAAARGFILLQVHIRAAAYVIYGPGAGIAEMREAFDCTFYFEMPKSPIMWALWGGNLIPMGRESPDPSYSWKDLYYVDFNLLDNQKWDVFERMDYFVDAANADRLTLIPRRAYDAIITTLLRYPIKQIRTFMPGPFGAYRFKDLWNVPGLDNSAWNSIASPKLDILIDIGGGKLLGSGGAEVVAAAGGN